MTNRDIFYNTATFPITDGLADLELSSGADWFILLSCPTNANVRVKINSMTAHEIPVKEAWQIGSKNIHTIYISCDAVADEFITIGQHDGNLEVITNPKIDKLDSITLIQSFSDKLLTDLDKITNPYVLSSRNSYSTASTSITTYLNIANLDCDKLRIILFCANASSQESASYVNLNGTNITGVRSFTTASYSVPNYHREIILENVRGLPLVITGVSGAVATVEKYNLKA